MQLRFVLLRQLHPFFLIKRLVRCLYNEIVRQSEVHKCTIDSAGMSISRLPVNPATAVQAPPPARPPTATPTPPEASPPTSIPSPDPPAIKAVERLPLPFLLRIRSLVSNGYCCPFIVSEVNRISSSDLPLKCPRLCDASITPPTGVPFGTSTLLSVAVTGSTNSPVNVSPARLVFTLMR